MPTAFLREGMGLLGCEKGEEEQAGRGHPAGSEDAELSSLLG